MADTVYRFNLQRLRRLFTAPGAEPLSDEQLLDQFARQGDEMAFTALVHRHGPLVLGACRRALPDPNDADDVFQATFLVLARKAGSIRKGRSVGSWLYGVAHRLAQRVRCDAARRHRHEQARERPASTAEPGTDLSWAEVRAALDNEMAGLSEKYRAPLLLCFVEGKTQDEAARQLGWSLGTFRRRLDRGREIMRARLARRGLALSAALLATHLTGGAVTAAVPRALADATVRGGMLAAAGQLPAGAAGSLAKAGIRGMLVGRLRTAGAVLLLVGALTGGAAVALQGRQDDPPPAAPAAEAAAPEPVDLHGDPLPPGALARLGTLRFQPGRQVDALAMSPDGKTVATLDNFNQVTLWDAATRKMVRTLNDRKTPAQFFAWSPDGKLLATGVQRGTIHFWDPASGKLVREVKNSVLQLFGISFAPDGKTLCASVDAGLLLFLDPETGRERYRLKPANAALPWALYSPDGKYIATVGETFKEVVLLDSKSGKVLRTLKGIDALLQHGTFSPDGRLFAAGGEGGALVVWEVAEGRLRYARLDLGSTRAIAFSPDGELLAAAGGNPAAFVGVWKAVSGREVWKAHATHQFTGLAFTPDGKHLYSGGGTTIRTWAASDGKEVRPQATHADYVFEVSLSPDGRTAVTAGNDGVAIVWDAATGKALRRLEGHTRGLHSAVFSPDGKLVATAGQDGSVRLWEAGSGRQLKTVFSYRDGKLPTPLTSGIVAGLAFSPDGKLLASADVFLNVMTVWDVASGKALQRLNHQEGFHCVAFSPDGGLVALGASGHGVRGNDPNDAPVIVWDVKAGKELTRWYAHSVSVSGVAFAPDGTTLATSGGAQGVRVWDVRTRKLLWSFSTEKGNKGGINRVAFSRDGRTLAASGYDPSVRIIEVATRQERAAFDGHKGTAWKVAFAPDGRRLVTGSLDGTGLVWDVTGLRLGGQTRTDLRAAWENLASVDARKAGRALWQLVGAGDEALAILRQAVKPADPALQSRLAVLLRDLDSPTFATRQRAAAELERLREQAEPAVRQALKTAGTVELQRRLEQVLRKIDLPLSGGEPVRGVRAVEALEQIGTTGARDLLRELANGPAEARLTREARDSLARLAPAVR